MVLNTKSCSLLTVPSRSSPRAAILKSVRLHGVCIYLVLVDSKAKFRRHDQACVPRSANPNDAKEHVNSTQCEGTSQSAVSANASGVVPSVLRL